jgi:hypothetical protein
VSLEQAAAQALATVTRARSLFASAPRPPPTGAPLESAAESTVRARQQMGGLSGAFVDRHGDFVGEQASRLAHAGQADGLLVSHLRDASRLAQDGARQLDAIVDRTRSLATAAATARTSADQRSVMAGLRSAVSAADDVVVSTHQRARAIASDIRALDYSTGGRIRTAGFGRGGAPEDPAPQPKKDPAEAARERDERIANDPSTRHPVSGRPRPLGRGGRRHHPQSAMSQLPTTLAVCQRSPENTWCRRHVGRCTPAARRPRPHFRSAPTALIGRTRRPHRASGAWEVMRTRAAVMSNRSQGDAVIG